MKTSINKNLILVRDNDSAHVSEATQQFIFLKLLMSWNIGQLLAQIWIPLKIYGE